MADVLSRIPPNSMEAEQSILGSMLLSESCVLAAIERLREEDFFAASHRRIWRAMQDLTAIGRPVDLVTVVERMEQTSKLSLEELNYLTELTGRVPSTRNIRSYIEIVREKSLLRKLIDVCGDVADMAFKGETEGKDVVSYAGDAIFRLTDGQSERTLTHVRSALMESYKLISDAAMNGSGMMGIPTGFSIMDEKLSGLQPGQLIVIAGRPGMGKTSFALNIAEYVSIHDQKVTAIFSLEMPREQLAMRLLCAGAQVDSQAARVGKLKENDYYSLTEAMEPIFDSGLYIDDTSHMGVMEMQTKLRRLRQQTGRLDLVVIDYLQLMGEEQKESQDNRQQVISKITRNLKVMAKELRVPIILLSQLSRANEKRENKRPMLSDLRESGSIEQDADVVLLLYRDDYYNEDADNKGDAIIQIAKQRNGPTGSIKMRWRGELTKYVEMDYVHEE